MKKESVFLLKVFCGLASVHLATLLLPIAAGMMRQYGGIDPAFLMAAGMLLVAPPLLAQNW